MTVLVTGGAGFVGSFLVERLLDEGKEVHVLDATPLAEAKNLQAVKDHPRLRYVQGDLRTLEDVTRFYRPEAEVLYHLGSVVGVHRYLEDPLKLADVVVGGTRNLLDHATRHGTRVLFTSTSEIFGRNPEVPWSEQSDRVLGPTSVDRWCYSSSKAVCEHMLYGLHRRDGLPMTIVRFFNLYGPRQSPDYVVSQSVHRALRGEPPLLYDGGTQTRCFTFIEDAVEGVLRASRREEAVGESFNLGSQTETSVREVVEGVLEASGATVGFRDFDTQREYGEVYEDIRRRIPDARKARDLLAWEATTPVREGLTRTVEWARANPWWLDAR